MEISLFHFLFDIDRFSIIADMVQGESQRDFMLTQANIAYSKDAKMVLHPWKWPPCHGKNTILCFYWEHNLFICGGCMFKGTSGVLVTSATVMHAIHVSRQLFVRRRRTDNRS